MRSTPKSPSLSTIIVAAIALSGPMLSPFAHAVSITNGGFEAGVTDALGFPFPGGTGVGGTATNWLVGDLSGWTMSPGLGGPGVLASNDSMYYGTSALSGPHSGELAAVFGNQGMGFYDGSISQLVTGLVSTNLYQLSFWLSNQAGVNGDINNYMKVNWGGSNLSYAGPNPALPGPIPVGTDWTQYTFTVAATGSSDLLTFTGGGSSPVLLDDVSLAPVGVPDLSPFGVEMGVGLVFLWIAGRTTRSQRMQRWNMPAA